jgi:hypothetical protein
MTHARLSRSLEVDAPPRPKMTVAQATTRGESLAGRINERARRMLAMTQNLPPGMRAEGEIDEDAQLDIDALDVLTKLGRFVIKHEAEVADIARRAKQQERGGRR